MDDSAVLRKMQEIFGFTAYKSGAQRDSIEAVLSGSKNVIVSMATNAGKSLCFQLTGALQQKGIILVISPNISLIQNQTKYLNNLENTRAVTINSTVPTTERVIIQDDISKEESTIKFFYLSPEMASTYPYPKLLNDMLTKGKISHVVLDEAHRAADGKFRRAALSNLKQFRLNHPTVPFVALTTASDEIIEEIKEFFGMQNPRIIKSTSVRTNIVYQAVQLDNNGDDDDIDYLGFFQSMAPEYAGLNAKQMPRINLVGIVYCTTIEKVARVVEKLNQLEVPATSFYAANENRFANYDEWMSGVKPVIVATTESFGHGILNQSLKFVLHVGLSKRLRSYYQESGRATECAKVFARIYYETREDNQEMQSYCLSKICRRKYLAEYFGEQTSDCVDMCDNCCSRYANN